MTRYRDSCALDHSALKLAGRRTEHPRVRSAIQSVVLASTGLLWAATLPLVLAAGTDAVTAVIIVVSLIELLTRKVERLSSNVHKFPFLEVSPNLHTGGPKVAAILSVMESCRRLKLPLRDFWPRPGLAGSASSGSHTLLPLRGSPSIHRLERPVVGVKAVTSFSAISRHN